MIEVIFGGQFGSEGKGLMASYLAETMKVDVATTDCGPNAGHTAIWEGKKVITYHLPMSGVLSPEANIYLNGGAIINTDILIKEIVTLENQGFKIKNRLIIHPRAALIVQKDIDAENDPNGRMDQIASTKKGVGAAAAAKVLRTGITALDDKRLHNYIRLFNIPTKDSVVVEVAQGYSLGVNAGFFPYTTHRACTPAQGLMNAEIPTTLPHRTWAVIRVNPIRVGNTASGYSGGFYSDQKETTWEELKQEPQYTTVTNRIRRVFTYSKQQIEKMILATCPNVILINFAQTTDIDTLVDMRKHIHDFYFKNNSILPQIMFGYGPKPEDIRIGIKQ